MRVRIVNCDAQSDFWVTAKSEKAAPKVVKKALDKSKNGRDIREVWSVVK